MRPAVMKDMVRRMIIRNKKNLRPLRNQKKKPPRNNFQRRSLRSRRIRNWRLSQEAWVLTTRKQLTNNKIIKRRVRHQPVEITCLKIRKRSRSRRRRLLKKLRKQRKPKEINKMQMVRNSRLRRNKQLSKPPYKKGIKLSRKHLMTREVIWLLS